LLGRERRESEARKRVEGEGGSEEMAE